MYQAKSDREPSSLVHRPIVMNGEKKSIGQHLLSCPMQVMCLLVVPQMCFGMTGGASDYAFQSEEVADAPQFLNKYDLWGIHDMLIAGYACPACNSLENGMKSRAHASVQNAAVDLAVLLPKVHPIEECRVAFQKVIGAYEVLVELSRERTKDMIDEVAHASWTCIDSSANCDSGENE